MLRDLAMRIGLCAACVCAGAAAEQRDVPPDEGPQAMAPSQEPGLIQLPEPAPPEEEPRAQAPRRVIDEIVVTAQKREQGLQDVPISITAVDSRFLAENAIGDFRDLSLFVPNARIDPNGTLPQISIRGFNAAPLNRAFEQAISLVVDGVTYGTSIYFQTPLYDIARVEVLRGPQGTLFGKNSTAGVFNIVTAEADREALSGSLSLQQGEIGRQRAEGAVGGALIDGIVNFRLSGLYDARDGLLRNTTADIAPGANRENNSRERKAVRLKLRFPEVLATQLDLSAEYLDSLVLGLGSEIQRAAPDLLPIYQAYDPNFDFIPDNFISSTDAAEFTRIAGATFVLNAQREIGDWSVAAVAGHSRLKFATLADTDFSPAPAIQADYDEVHPQDTLELRTVSPEFDGLFGLGAGRGSRLTTGLFWQHRRFEDSFSRVRVDPVSAGLLLGINRSGAPPLPVPTTPGEFAGNPVINNTEDDEVGVIYFEQATRSLAGFGQLEWTFLPSLTLQLGLRYSVDDKKGSWESVFEQSEGVILTAALGREEYSARRERRETSLTPKVLLQYDLSDRSNAYFGWVRGFRGGGFNAFASTTADLEYDEENVQSWESGIKLRFLDGAASLNLGLYWMTLTDFQVLTQDPNTAVFTVINAGKARARGVEMDGQWLPTQWLTLQATLAFNDSSFLEFPFGTCTIDNRDTDGDGDPRCDLKGQPLDFAPRVTATFSPRVNWPLGLGGWEIVAGATALYQDEYFADIAVRDPRVIEPASLRFDAHLGIHHAVSGLSLRVVGQNLSDERVSLFISDVPTVAGTFYQSPEPPRLLFVELGWKF
jgi:iron complex outermembrane recepter protein